MKHLKRYNESVIKAASFDIEDIKDMFLTISDMGVKVQYVQSGSEVFANGIVYDIILTVKLELKKLSSEVSFDMSSRNIPIITDNRYWELMKEILEFKDRISVFGLNCFINFEHVWDGRDYKLTLYIIKNKESIEVKEDETFKKI